MATATGTFILTNLDADDRRAGKICVTIENVRRTARKLPLLPVSTMAEIKASYELLLAQHAMQVHLGNIGYSINEANNSSVVFQQVKQKFADATKDKQKAVLDLLNTP